MRKTAIGLIMGFTIFIFSCGGAKYSVNKLPQQFIELGNGGGFSGAYTYYKIATNGQVFTSKSGDTAYSVFGAIPKKTAQDAYKSLAKWQDQTSSQPGNMNYFIFRSEGDSMSSWLWSDDKKPVSGVEEVYKTLNDALANIKPGEK